MNDALKTQISALIDGELPENEAELLLRRLNQDAAMREQVATYLAIGRYIRRDAELPGMDGLRGRIANALGEDVLVAEQPAVAAKSRFLKPTLGFAVAASVAVLAVVGLRQSVLPESGDSASTSAVASIEAATAITQPAAFGADEEVVSEELRQMYRRHSASSADFGGNGIITRLVTMELQDGELVVVSPDKKQGSSAAAGSANRPDGQPDLRLDGTSVDGESQAD